MDNDCDVKETAQPTEKQCHCPSSNKISEQPSDKPSDGLIQKLELDSEPENIEQAMEEYLEKESENQEDQPLDCTLDFIKMPQPERDWRDYKPGIEGNTGSQISETTVNQMEHQMEHQTEPMSQGNLIKTKKIKKKTIILLN